MWPNSWPFDTLRLIPAKCGKTTAMDLTERAWLIVQKAQEEAQALGDDYVGTDHMLLAILRDGEGAGAYVLDDLGVRYDTVFERLVTTT